MPLSEYEQRVLEQMERQLSTDDPKLADTFQTSRGENRSSVRYVLAGVGVVVGLLMLVLGVAQSMMIIGIIGFGVMFGAVVFAFSKPHHKSETGPIGSVGPDGRVRPAARKPRGKQDFMRRLEDRWDQRRDDGR